MIGVSRYALACELPFESPVRISRPGNKKAKVGSGTRVPARTYHLARGGNFALWLSRWEVCSTIKGPELGQRLVLELVEARIEPVAGQQLLVGAFFADPPLV